MHSSAALSFLRTVPWVLPALKFPLWPASCTQSYLCSLNCCTNGLQVTALLTFRQRARGARPGREGGRTGKGKCWRSPPVVLGLVSKSLLSHSLLRSSLLASPNSVGLSSWIPSRYC